MASFTAALLGAIPVVNQVLKVIKPATTASEILKSFPQIEAKFGKSRAYRIASWLIKWAMNRGYGYRHCQ